VRELISARWWGCPSPGYFDSLPLSERLDIVAVYELDWRMAAVNAHEAQQEAEAKSRQAARRSRSKGKS
jgi:uncharacterized small protein (DUF1192 family)